MQQRALELVDLSGFWVFGDSRAEASWLGGTGLPKDPPAEVEECEAQMVAGGGGLQRAFFSEYKDQFKNEIGQVMFSEIAKAYTAELNKESSQMLDAIREKAAAGTVSYQERFKQEGGHGQGLLSSFGIFRRKRPAVSRLGVQQAQALLNDINHELEPLEPADASVGALVQRQNAVCDVVTRRVEGDLSVQLSVLRRASRLEAMQRRAAERAEDAKLSQQLCSPCCVGDIDLSQALVPKHGALRQLPGNPGNIRWSDSAVGVSTAAAAHVVKKHDASMSKIIDQYEAAHAMVTDDSCKLIGDLPEKALPSPCIKEGFGVCLCSNSSAGPVIKLARRAIASGICRLCPPKSIMRKFLSESRIVLHFRDTSIWLHVGLMYFNPQRPTLITLRDEGLSKWGYTRLQPAFGGAGELECRADTEVVQSLMPYLHKEMSLQLFRLMAFDRALSRFVPADNVLVGKIASHHLYRGDELKFWPGAAAALAKGDAKRDRRRQEEARRRARRTDSEVEASRKRRKSKTNAAGDGGQKATRTAKGDRKQTPASSAATSSDLQRADDQSGANNDVDTSDAASPEFMFESPSMSPGEAEKDLSRARAIDGSSNSDPERHDYMLFGDANGAGTLVASSSNEETRSFEADGPFRIEEDLSAIVEADPGFQQLQGQETGLAANPVSSIGGQCPDVGTPPASIADTDSGDTDSGDDARNPQATVGPLDYAAPWVEQYSPTTPVEQHSPTTPGKSPRADSDVASSPAARGSPNLGPLQYSPTTPGKSPRADSDVASSPAARGSPKRAGVRSSSSGSESGVAAAPRTRGPATVDRAIEGGNIPEGCSCRRYDPLPPEPPYYCATLPAGVFDMRGRHTRRRAFRPGLRTEAEAIDLCETWLVETMSAIEADDE